MKKAALALLTSSMLIVGCATSQNPNDPYESFNRKVFKFNMAADHYVLRPIAVGYSYVPEPIRDAISNFYNNLRDFVSLANDVLQLDGMNTMQTTMRVSINSVFGILGLIDVASSMGLPQYRNSFGATFKRWGWQHSSYLIAPLLGPGTFRDDLGIIPDVYFNPLFYLIQDPLISYSIFAINIIDTRTKLLGQDQLLNQTLDPYATIRDLYLQHTGEYKYPSQNESSTTSGDDDSNIDELLDEESQPQTAGRRKQAAAANQDIDQIIDEQNQAEQNAVQPTATAN